MDANTPNPLAEERTEMGLVTKILWICIPWKCSSHLIFGPQFFRTALHSPSRYGEE